MKKLIGCIVLFIIIASNLISCEKDDICADTTPTTPNMVVAFYENDNRNTYNRVTNLQYFEVGSQDTIKVGSVDSTLVPLRVNAASTKWGFIYHKVRSNSQIDTLVDYLEFKYGTWQRYVSRACGFKTQFLLDPDNPSGSNPVLTTEDGWIKDVQIVKDSIIDENQAHVKVYF